MVLYNETIMTYLKAVPISQARATLFDLFDRVIAEPGHAVHIVRQGHDEQAVLVSASYLAELQATAAHRAPVRSDPPAFGPGAFRFPDGGDVDAEIAANRAEQARLLAEKVAASGL
jgi:PHD/YefM family antitoxin component YafN of YafNO toxin-antitoxin module